MPLFKTPEVAQGWPAEADPRLVGIVAWLEREAATMGIVPPVTITSFLRRANAGSPHADGRAVDLRVRDWPVGTRAGVAAAINARWSYAALGGKPEINTAVFGTLDPTGRHWDHVHVQVPPPKRSGGAC